MNRFRVKGFGDPVIIGMSVLTESCCCEYRSRMVKIPPPTLFLFQFPPTLF